MIPTARIPAIDFAKIAIATFVALAFAPRGKAAEIRYVMEEYRNAFHDYHPPDHLMSSAYGVYKNLGMYQDAIERPDGTVIPINSDIPGTLTTVRGWNASGLVIGNTFVPGTGREVGFVYENGKMTYLKDPKDLGPWNLYTAYAVNDSGRVVGGGSRDAPFIYRDGQFEEIPLPEGFSGGTAVDINESNLVVGFFRKEGKSSLEGMPFLYADGQVLDLSGITSGLEGYKLVQPFALFDDGRIVVGGQKYMYDGSTQGGLIFLRPFDPSIDALPPAVPEPSTIAVWVLAAGSVILRKRRRHSDS